MSGFCQAPSEPLCWAHDWVQSENTAGTTKIMMMMLRLDPPVSANINNAAGKIRPLDVGKYGFSYRNGGAREALGLQGR